jgi:hypothetical protein
MARCVACEEAAPATGWLCEECAAANHGVTRRLPEQIVTHGEPSDAVLVDRWGRTHPLAARSVIGRDVDGSGFGISEASVSRRHAEILRKRDGSWWVVDLVSSNGTTVDDEPVTAPRQLESRNVVFFGELGWFFITPPPGPLPVPAQLPGTHRPPDSKKEPADSGVAKIYDATDDGDELEPDAAYTFSGLRQVDLTFASPSGGGGGVVELAGQAAQLTDIQYQLLRLLAERMFGEDGRDERVRGFVRSTELLASLPWDTARPEDNHIKQLVRRVRRALVRAQIGDLIESRQGFGYRLRVRLDRAPPKD